MIAQTLPEVVPDRRIIDDANARQPANALLRPRSQRPCRRRAAEQRNDLAPPDHSITSSARARSVGGTSMPSALAVLRLIPSSYLVGACTGRLAGFSPLEDAIDILGRLSKLLKLVGPVKDQSAPGGEEAEWVDGGQPMARSEFDDWY